MMRRIVHSVLVAAAGAFASSCDVVGDDECGDNQVTTLLDANTAAELYGSPAFTQFILSGKRHFYWSFLVEGICASEHAEPEWQLLINPTQLPPGWEVSASYATTAVSNTDVTLTASNSGASIRRYYATADVGMEQGSVLGRAQMALDIEFAFTSQGDFSTDSEIAQHVDPGIVVVLRYKAATASASLLTSPK
jgi:hypothetical protein